jgi:hypothetical protein
MKPIAALTAAIVAFHLFFATGYGIFRDELYYLACAQHLAWGYVDHPPLVALIAWLVRHTIGTSPLALRFLPALAAGGMVYLTAAITRELGGQTGAQLLAGLVMALAPIELGMFSFFSMNAFDLVVWAALLFMLVRLLRTGEGRLWLPIGVLAGVGLENKVSVLFLIAALGIALVAARRWEQFKDRRLWLGLGAAALLFAPHVLWQVRHGWPTLEFIHQASATKNVPLSPLGFLAAQAELMNPLAAPLLLIGLAALFRRREYRVLGWLYPALLVLFLAGGNAKAYYLAPIYPLLAASGAVTLASWRPRWALPAYAGIIAVSGALFAPLARPLLSEDRYVAYAAALGFAPSTDERTAVGRLPQFFADMHGWRELAAAVAQVHATLSPDERAQACVFGQNYGQAGAIDLYGPAPALSGHNAYWMWGPGRCTGQVLIVIGGHAADHARFYGEVTPSGTFSCRDCMPYESQQTLWVLRRPRQSLTSIWPLLKHYR